MPLTACAWRVAELDENGAAPNLPDKQCPDIAYMSHHAEHATAILLDVLPYAIASR